MVKVVNFILLILLKLHGWAVYTWCTIINFLVLIIFYIYVRCNHWETLSWRYRGALSIIFATSCECFTASKKRFFKIIFLCLKKIRKFSQSLSHVWLCNPMSRSSPGLPVHHQLPKLTQTHLRDCQFNLLDQDNRSSWRQRLKCLNTAYPGT